MDGLKDRVAWVTGSSRGIGAAIARLFAEHGAKVAVHGRDAEALAATHAGIERAGGRAIAVTGDVTRFADLEAARQRIEQELGPVEQIAEEGWRASVDGNLTATFLTIKSVLPGMKERRRGTIVTMSSSAGRRAHPRSPIPYAAAKAGIELMTQTVAAQAGPFGIRVTCIAPETILTERNLQRIPVAQQAELAAVHPLARLGTPEDVARAALFLASEEAAWITGVILDVAGGATMVR
jgi:3-oxoacyl-[acyl-carrier protein] reductase